MEAFNKKTKQKINIKTFNIAKGKVVITVGSDKITYNNFSDFEKEWLCPDLNKNFRTSISRSDF